MTPIPIFLGGGNRYTPIYTAVCDALCSGLRERNLLASIYPRINWNYRDPLQGVVEHMRLCYGCLVVSVPRYYARNQYEFPNSDKQTMRTEVFLPSVWDYIEATAAYVRGIPLLSIVDETLSTQAILSLNYAEYHAYKCVMAANYPRVSDDLGRELDTFALRVTDYHRSMQ